MTADLTDRTAVVAAIRTILAEHGKLAVDPATIEEDADLFAAGLTSHASVSVMLACEDFWDVEFPTPLLKKSTFATISALAGALAEIGVA